jgi:biotin-[acetyl-CoA-carboxylase] ligase BirA-like protein
MAVYTDNRAYGEALLPGGVAGEFAACAGAAAVPAEVLPLLQSCFEDVGALHAAPLDLPGWRHILASEYAHGSHYDKLIELARAGPVPDRSALVARAGSGFRGFRGRSWTAHAGNLHVVVHFAPRRTIERFDTVFTALAAVAAAEAIDGVRGLAGQARIKWVNDVLVSGRKVAGVLAYTQTRDSCVTSVVLGIGLNVETTPAVERTAYVPAAGSLRELAPAGSGVGAPQVLHDLLRALEQNYTLVLAHGYAPIMDRYRERSAVLGEDVTIRADDGTEAGRVLAEGRVAAIGDGLELHLAGQAEPVRNGRLILGRASAGGVK